MRHGIRTSFLLQAMLILLPTVVLAVVGFHLVQRDRESVIQEARQRAELLVPDIANFVGSRILRQMQDDLRDLLQKRNQIGAFNADLRISRGSNKDRSQFDVPMEQFWALKESLPPSNRGHVFNGSFSWVMVLGRDGGLLAPKPYQKYPRPIYGDQTISDDERKRIEKQIRSTLSRTNVVSDLKRVFNDEISSENARVVYELANEFRDEDETHAASNLFELLAGLDVDCFTESGLPLQPLAYLSLARIRVEELNANTSKANRSSYQSVLRDLGKSAINFPSSLSEPIFDFIDDGLSTASPDFSPEDHAWRNHWQTLNSTIDFHRALTGSKQLLLNNDGAPAAHWLRWNHMDWWVGFSPELIEVDEKRTPRSMCVLPFSFLSFELAVPELTDMGKFLLPAGLGVEFLIDGRRIGGSEPLHEILATASADIVGGGPHRYANFPNYFEERPVGELVAQIVIAQPDILLALQRERSRWLFGIIGGALLVTLIGLAMIYRNHVHQLALNEMKTNFVSSVSHELRAPIASVRLMAENLQQGKVTGESKLKEYVGFIGQECRRLSSLIENVLDFSRIEQGRKQYELEPTDLNKLIEDTVRLMQPYAEEREVELQVRIDGRDSCHHLGIDESGDKSISAPIELNIDGRAIQQALINLVDNAIKHSPTGRPVEIEVNCGATIHLSVADHGSGIPKEDHVKIFERFFRRGSELRRETQGIGIGLSIVKHIVEGHGGRVWVESEAGNGSRFVIELISTSDGHE